MLKYGREYARGRLAEYEQKMREQLERSLHRKAAALGYELVAKHPSPAEPPSAPTLA